MDIELATDASDEVPPDMVSQTQAVRRDRVAEIITHSEAVVQILGVPPRWMVRWCATAMVAVLCFLAALAWLIHYPDVVTGGVVITMPAPPAIVVAQTSGHLETMSARDGDIVARGTVLARIQNSADPDAVAHLAAALAYWQGDHGPSDTVIAMLARLPLGELQGDFAALARAHADYSWHLTADPIEAQMRALAGQRIPLRDRLESLRRQQALQGQEVQVAERAYARVRDMARHQDAAMPTVEERERSLLDAKRGLEGNQIDVANTQLDLDRIDQSLLDMSERDRQQRRDLLAAFHEAVTRLSGRLAAWERTYVLRAPITGKVSFAQFWTNSQFIQSGEAVMAIVPEGAQAPFGRVSLPINRAGSVHVGQPVFIRLDNYPGEQFGLLKGRVAAISRVPLAARFVLDVALPEGLTTTFGRHLVYQQEMQGQAQIVIEDLRVIDRIFYQARRLSAPRSGGSYDGSGGKS